MKRTLSSLLAGTFALALAVPALAIPASSGDMPSCGDDEKKGDHGDKNPSAAEPQCGDDEKKGDHGDKNPSAAEPQCGGDEKKGDHGDKKDPARS